MKTSIVIPSYNRHSVLERCLNCLNENSVFPTEVIVIDDGSDPPIAFSIQFSNLKFPVFVRSNTYKKGAPGARNTGIDSARGDIIIFIDDDIFVRPDFVQSHIDIHAQSRDERAFVGHVSFSRQITNNFLLNYMQTTGAFKDVYATEDNAKINNGLISANFSIKSKILSNKYRFNENFPYNRNEDTEFGYRLIKEAGVEFYFNKSISVDHYSPLTLNNILQQTWQGGQCKAYWSICDPDATEWCLSLFSTMKNSLNRESVEILAAILQEKYQLLADVPCEQFSQHQIAKFNHLLSKLVCFYTYFGILDFYNNNVYAFQDISSLLFASFQAPDEKGKIEKLKQAHNLNKDFFPLAHYLCNIYENSNMYNEAIAVLEDIPLNNWSCGYLSNLYFKINQFDKSANYIKKLFSCSSADWNVFWNQRMKTIGILRELYNNNCLDKQFFENIYYESINSPSGSGFYNLTSDMIVASDYLVSTKNADDFLSSILRETNRYKKITTKGQVFWYSQEKHFGFIKNYFSDTVYFFKRSFLRTRIDNIRDLAGFHVNFIPSRGVKGYEARDIKLIF